MPKNKYFTVIQVAKMMGITRGAIYKQISKGQIYAENTNGHLFIPAHEIDELVPKKLTDKIKADIEKGVVKVVREYGETLRMLGKE